MDEKEGVTLRTGKINVPAYVDDVAIMVEDKEAMKGLMTRLKRYVEKKELKINTSKTKIMPCTKRKRKITQ